MDHNYEISIDEAVSRFERLDFCAFTVSKSVGSKVSFICADVALPHAIRNRSPEVLG